MLGIMGLGGWQVILAISFLAAIQLAGCVVVDGEKRKLSATKHQTNERRAIDQLNVKTCGIADPDMDEHEFVNMARAGQFPWMVSLQVSTPEGATEEEQEIASKENDEKQVELKTGHRERGVHFCAGFLISDKWILTAAHCFASPQFKTFVEHDKLMVVAGSHKVDSRVAENRNLTVSRVFYHSKFSTKIPVGYDIALIELKDRVQFTRKRPSTPGKPFMNAICLPLKDKRYKLNETARLVGWGLSSDGDITSSPSKLLTTDILIGDTDKCVDRYVKALKSNRPRRLRKQVDDLICAHYKNTRDACQADSGGPLIEFASHKAVVIGIVSYGIGCATKGVPGIYTRVSAYIDWVKELLKKGKDAKVDFSLIEVKQNAGKGRGDIINIVKITKNAGNSTTTSTRSPDSSSTSGPTVKASSTTAAPSSSTSSTTSSPASTTTTRGPTTTTTTITPTNKPTERTSAAPVTTSPEGSFKFFDQER